MQPELYLEYLQIDYSFITYDVYCEALDLVMTNQLTEGFFDNIKQMRLSRELVRLFSDLKNNILQITRDLKLGLVDVISAFKQKDVYQILRAFKFNFKLMLRAIGEFTKFVRLGLLEIFREIYRTRAFQKLRSGAMKVDEFLDRYPRLKKVGGIVIAGLLLYIWLNMTFIGDLDYDFNFSDISDAIQGKFSITDLFTSPEGLMLMSLFGSGSILGISIPWLGATAYNLTLAIVYTAYHKYKKHDYSAKNFFDEFKKRIKKGKLQ